MRDIIPRIVLACVCCVAALVAIVSGGDSADAQQVSDTTSTSVTCVPFNVSVDGGPTIVECGSGFRAVYMETESATPAYVCGKSGGYAWQRLGDGGTRAGNYATVCLKRCVGCNNGSAFIGDLNRGAVKCVSGTADAGVVFAVQCGR